MKENFLFIYREWSVCSSWVVYGAPPPLRDVRVCLEDRKEGGLLDVVAVATEGFTVWV